MESRSFFFRGSIEGIFERGKLDPGSPLKHPFSVKPCFGSRYVLRIRDFLYNPIVRMGFLDHQYYENHLDSADKNDRRLQVYR